VAVYPLRQSKEVKRSPKVLAIQIIYNHFSLGLPLKFFTACKVFIIWGGFL